MPWRNSRRWRRPSATCSATAKRRTLTQRWWCMVVLANEALLTGESEEVTKVMVVEDVDEPFAKNMCFMSTTVTNGVGKGVVTTTGMKTQVGQIAKALKTAKKAENKLTPLQ